MTRAYQLASAEVARSSITATAERIGIKRPTLSLYLSGKYPAGVTRIERRILATLDQWVCQFMDQQISAERCREIADLADPPAQSARALNHWRACQICAHNPHRETEEA